MHHYMMESAQQNQVVQIGRTAIRPVFDVMGICVLGCLVAVGSVLGALPGFPRVRFPETARRTRRATLTATGSPRSYVCWAVSTIFARLVQGVGIV